VLTTVASPRSPSFGRRWLHRAAHGTSAPAGVGQPTSFPDIAGGVDYDGRAVVRRLPTPTLLTDVAVAAVFLVIGLLTAGGGVRPVLVSIVFAAALGLRRASPLIAAALCWTAGAVQLAAGWHPQAVDAAALGVIYGLSAYGNRLARLVGLTSIVLGAGVVTGVSLAADEETPFLGSVNPGGAFAAQAAVVFFAVLVLFGFCWVLGLLARARRVAMLNARASVLSDFERDRAEDRIAVEQHRTRIARDMHDVVAHSLAVVVAQADGTRYAHAGDQKVVEHSLQTISSTARSALIEVEHLLGELRAGEQPAPEPAVGGLAELVERLRAAGLDVKLEQTGSAPPLRDGDEVALYRIVQEALTNALRHGDTREPVTVTCQSEERGVRVTVVNRLRRPATGDGSARRSGDQVRTGHGVPGMRERAEQAGGSLEVQVDQRSFTVRAFLPASPTEPGASR
jgi:signal transduction histidine kinase